MSVGGVHDVKFSNNQLKYYVKKKNDWEGPYLVLMATMADSGHTRGVVLATLAPWAWAVATQGSSPMSTPETPRRDPRDRCG